MQQEETHKIAKEEFTICKKKDLMCKLKWIEFNHVCHLLSLANNKALQKHQKIHNKKFSKLSEVSCEGVSHDPDKVI